MHRSNSVNAVRWLVLAVAVALIAISTGGCVTPAGLASFNSANSFGGGSNTNSKQECKLNSDGTETCGYDCKLGSGGRFNCASTPEGSCKMAASGDVVCTDPEPSNQTSAAASQPTQKAAQPASPASGSSQSSSGGQAEIRCCVNGAFYDCPSANDAAICVGEPMQLMNCVQNCGMSSDCENKCIDKHGPHPEDSQCSRQVPRDNECDQR